MQIFYNGLENNLISVLDGVSGELPQNCKQNLVHQSDEVNYVGNRGGNPYSNTYNPGWKDHSNLMWGGNQGGNIIQNQVNPSYQPPHIQRSQDRSMGSNHTVCHQQLDQINGEIHSMKMDIRKVQFKCTLIRNILTYFKESIPSQMSQMMEMMSNMQRKFGTRILSDRKNNPCKKGNEDFVNLPFLELIDKIPKYANAIVAKKISPKLKDLGSLTISIEIRDIYFNEALYDLGANINLMPLSIYRKLRLGELKNTSITLQLVDKSLVHPKGVLEDMLVKVRNFIVPVDFVIPILLCWAFLTTSKSTIDLEKNELTMKIDGEIEVFRCGYDSQDEGLGKQLGK
ncbi:gag-asp_proteas domain-containing protein [Gossypium australe]|uniref:Gag-asp_proteas domain-containing protein n=1 Tax=Gossypium australe TaxID=47621 RepID=A0A5B6VDM6_9ROSI|nr:gag-asp_proteas domain-containing protein [Gossypium australe]